MKLISNTNIGKYEVKIIQDDTKKYFVEVYFEDESVYISARTEKIEEAEKNAQYIMDSIIGGK